MSTIIKPNTFSAGATIIAAEHNDNWDTLINDYNGSINNSNIASNAAISDTKLNTISTANKVNGSAITGLANLNTATAGTIPSASIPAINLAGTSTGGVIGILPGANIDTGTTAGKIVALNASAQLPAVSGALLTNLPVFNQQVFTSTGAGTWTKPATGTIVLVELWGAGGSGGKRSSGGGGGGGGGGAYKAIWIPITKLGTTEAVSVGAGGAAQTSADTGGSVGGNTTFGASGTLITAYGGGAGAGNNDAGNGGGGGGSHSVGLATGAGGDLFGSPAPVRGNFSTEDTLSTNSIYGGGGSGMDYYNSTDSAGTYSIFGGGGGGEGNEGSGASIESTGGNSTYGGGGGGGGANDTVGGTAGTSYAGGNGGAGATGAAAATAGSQPGGGGGGSETGTSGAGGAGKVVVTVW